MKANKYTYIVSIDKKHSVIFNGIIKEFIVIDTDKVNSFVQLLKKPDTFKETHSKIIQLLQSKGIIIDDHINERDYLTKEKDIFVNSKEYKTTILPTFECNYNCWYCVQKHEPVKIEQEKIDLIIKHVKKYLIENQIESYVLSWFGGEPLTQPNIIEYISQSLKQFCNKHNIQFNSGITTNGALLTEKVINILKNCDVNYYQIAIDGDEKTHNNNKKEKEGKSSFAIILTNIVNLIKINENAHVTLRLNYTIATLKSDSLISDITKYIPTDIRHRIKVDLQKVWQIQEKTIPMDLFLKLQRDFVSSGFQLCIDHVFAICYVEKQHYNMIYYNGGVEKCDKQPMDKLRGYLNADGNIIWKERPIFPDYNVFDSNSVCNNCYYYPLCYSGCPVRREELIIKSNKLTCGYEDYYEVFEQRIVDYCWRVIHNNKLNQYK